MKYLKTTLRISLFILFSVLSFTLIKQHYFSPSVASEILPWDLKWGMSKDEIKNIIGKTQDIPDKSLIKYTGHDLIQEFPFLGHHYKIRFLHSRMDGGLEEVVIYPQKPDGFDNLKNAFNEIYGAPLKAKENNYTIAGTHFKNYKGFWKIGNSGMMLNRMSSLASNQAKPGKDLSLLILSKNVPDIKSEFPTLTTVKCETTQSHSNFKKAVSNVSRPTTLYIDPYNQKLTNEYHLEPGHKDIFNDESIVYSKDTKNSRERFSLNRKSGVFSRQLQLKKENINIEEWGYCAKVAAEAAL